MRKRSVMVAGLILLTLVLSGCISGELTETVKADGAVHRFMSIDKTGLLMNANCNYLKNMAQNSSELNVSDLEYFEQFCRETDSEIIIEFDMPYGNENNPVKIIEKEDGTYLRYEAELLALTTTKVVMPSKVTSHNGELLTENTVAFKGSDALNNISNPDNPKTIIFVESKKPEFDLSILIYVIGGIIVIGLIIGGYLLLRKNK